MATTFSKLNESWNAEPNAPGEMVVVDGTDVSLVFRLNPFAFTQFRENQRGVLRFKNCWRYRLGPTNDEGWYLDQCRFSKLAPAWGEFYEVRGDLLLERLPEKSWVVIAKQKEGSRHFLFYLRDRTFECDAASWNFSIEAANDA